MHVRAIKTDSGERHCGHDVRVLRKVERRLPGRSLVEDLRRADGLQIYERFGLGAAPS
jgi:hypothetical protein